MVEKKVETTGLLGWIDARFPASELWKAHLFKYYMPKSFNFWCFFGSLALLVLVIQIVTDIFLVTNYKPDGTLNAADILATYADMEFIMHEVPWGWLVCCMYSTGISAFFAVVYLHMSRDILHDLYRRPCELVQIFGCLIFLCPTAEAFMGYLLLWGQMSYWDAQVIVNLFLAIPLIGPDLSLRIHSDYVVSDVTLNRFFSFRVIVASLVLLGLTAAHITVLHEVGSNNPGGIEIKTKKDKRGIPLDGTPLHLHYSMHDIVSVTVFLPIFSVIVFFAPETGGYFFKISNFISADPLRAPPHIAPIRYFTPFYLMLRTTTSDFLSWLWGFIIIMLGLLFVCSKSTKVKGVAVVVAVALTLGLAFIDTRFWDVIVMGGSVVIFSLLPWLGQSPIKSIRYRPGFHKTLLVLFVAAFAVLGYLGIQSPSPAGSIISQIDAILCFTLFLVMPIWGQIGTFKPVPERVTSTPH